MKTDKDALATVLNLVIRHSLSHRYDSGDLAVAIEFLKAVRDKEPERIARLYDTWAEELTEWRA